jgi:hypothetical protein
MRSATVELATRLNVTRQRIGQLEQEGVLIRAADGTLDIEANVQRYRLYSAGDTDSICDEAERLLQALDAGLGRMRAERKLAERRRLGREIAPLIGRLDSMLRLGTAMTSMHARPMLTSVITLCSGRLLEQYLELTNTRIVNDREKRRGGVQLASLRAR